MRLRRTLLFVPGTSPEQLARAARSAADGVVLDLGEGVPPGGRAQAREWVVAALRRVAFGTRERIVRINPPDRPEGEQDLAAVVPARPEALLLPRLGEPAELAAVDARVAGLEVAAGLPVGGIRFHVLVETVAAVCRVAELGRASARTAALVFGAGTLLQETRGRPGASRVAELFALGQVLLAARAAGLDAIDTAFPDPGDAPGLAAHAHLAADLGYDGKSVIHLDQVDLVNGIFTPSAQAIAAAEATLAAAGGEGDALHAATARIVLSRARLAGVL